MSSGMALTPSGRRLLPHAEGIIGAVAQLGHAAQGLRGQPTGKLSLGTVLEPSFLRVGDLLARCGRTLPADRARAASGRIARSSCRHPQRHARRELLFRTDARSRSRLRRAAGNHLLHRLAHSLGRRAPDRGLGGTRPSAMDRRPRCKLAPASRTGAVCGPRRAAGANHRVG
jgi:hypothetical protein